MIWSYGYNNHPNMTAVDSLDVTTSNIHNNESIGSSGIVFECIFND